MIIKSHSVNTGTAQRVCEYVLAQGANESVEVLEGASDGLLDADYFARAAGHKNSILHITISPVQEIIQGELAQVISAINEEFGFDCSDPHLLVRHVSTRSNGARLSHYHLLRSATDANGRVYDTYRSKKKDETVSRLMEIKLGHTITPGKHSDFVHDRFIERGMVEYAERISGLIIEKPIAAMGSKQQQKARRKGVDPMVFTKGVRGVAALPVGDQAKAFAALLMAHVNYTIEQGSRESRLLVKKDGDVICNVNRILKKPAPDVGRFIEQVRKEIESGKARNGKVGSQNKVPNSCRNFSDAGKRARSIEGSDSGSSKRRTPRRREFDPRSVGNADPEPMRDNRRQSDSQKQYRCDSEDLRRTQSGLAISQLSMAAINATPLTNDLKDAVKSYSESSAEPIPDIDDPYLMMKLSRALAKSMENQFGS